MAMQAVALGWDSSAKTDRGAKRKINEDAVISRPDIGLWAAADGMGGHEAGDVASKMVTHALGEVERNGPFADFIDAVEDALVAVNKRLREHSATMFGGRTMGSTVVSFLGSEKLGACLWAGDSRLYRLRDRAVTQVSCDHSEVQELVDRGVLSEEEAENHPNSNVITRAVGGANDLYVDIMLFDIQVEDVYLLCSDGLYNELSLLDIQERLTGDVDRSAELLLQASLDRGARDNVSVVVVKVS